MPPVYPATSPLTAPRDPRPRAPLAPGRPVRPTAAFQPCPRPGTPRPARLVRHALPSPTPASRLHASCPLAWPARCPPGWPKGPSIACPRPTYSSAYNAMRASSPPKSTRLPDSIDSSADTARRAIAYRRRARATPMGVGRAYPPARRVRARSRSLPPAPPPPGRRHLSRDPRRALRHLASGDWHPGHGVGNEPSHCAAAATVEQLRRTALGYRTFRCRRCRRICNERTGPPYIHRHYPTDLVLLSSSGGYATRRASETSPRCSWNAASSSRTRPCGTGRPASPRS